MRLQRSDLPRRLNCRSTGVAHPPAAVAPVRIHADKRVTAIRKSNPVESRALQPNGLRRPSFAQGERPAPVRVDHFHVWHCAHGLCRCPQLQEGIHQARSTERLTAREITRRVVHEGHKDGMKRQIVGEIFKSRSEE